MRKLILIISAVIFFSFVFLSGCTDENSTDDNQDSNGELMMVYVDDDFNSAVSGWGVDYFNTIQDGIDNVASGGTIQVRKGIYFENIVIERPMKLNGEDKETTIIDGSQKWEVVKVYSNGCSIQNFKIRNSKINAGVRIIGNNATLSNNIISQNRYGILIEGQSEVSAKSNNLIRNNIINNNENGVKLINTRDTEISNNQFISNNDGDIVLELSYNAEIKDNILGNFGLAITGSSEQWTSHIIENNIANDKKLYYYSNENSITVPDDAFQVILANCSDIEIKDINFENVLNGVLIGYSSNVRVENNNFSSNNGNAIELYSSDKNTILGNSFNQGNGIEFSKSNNNSIQQNNFNFNEISIRMSTSNNNDISSNNILSCSNYGIYFQFSSNENEVYGNKINNNKIGFRIKGSKSNIVFNNEFKSNYDKGLYICCGAEKNVVYNNSFITNAEHVDYTISKENTFYKDEIGNYWDDYLDRYPTATQLNGIWSFAYQIPGSNYSDEYPLVNPVDI